MAIHLAANEVWLGGRCVQRCLICGHKLLDSLGMNAADSGDFSCFPVGAWVKVEGGFPTSLEVVGQTESPLIPFGDIPEGCCTEGQPCAVCDAIAHWISGRASCGQGAARVCSKCGTAVAPDTEAEQEAACWRSDQ